MPQQKIGAIIYVFSHVPSYAYLCSGLFTIHWDSCIGNCPSDICKRHSIVLVGCILLAVADQGDVS